MTATNEVIVPIPALLEHQIADALDPRRFKVLRKGRRWGKDRLAFHVAWFGHGPDDQWPGILEGWDVAWLAPDFKQGRGIWQEEVVPRFQNIPGVSVNQQDRTVILDGCGGLYFYSAENVDAIRGLGKRLKGVVINEAAHLDLSYAWRTVIRPILADNRGWAIIMSTTNAGTDGGLDDDSNRRVPSYFNTLCDEIRTGARSSSEWMESEGTAAENPKIGEKEFASLVAEYPKGSISLDQEVYAKLLAPGTGLAFPEWRDAVHVVDSFKKPDHWHWAAGFDWGFHQPSVFVLCAHGPESETVVVKERKWTQTSDHKLGRDIADMLLDAGVCPDYIAADSATSQQESKSGYANTGEGIQRGINDRWTERSPETISPQLVYVPKSNVSRVTRAGLLHRYLHWEERDGKVTVQPRLRVLKSCTYMVSSLPKLPPDPLKPEDVDTQSDDHGYDALTYLLQMRPPFVDSPPPPAPDRDRHPGLAERHKLRLQAMGLIPGGAGKQGNRYQPKRMQKADL